LRNKIGLTYAHCGRRRFSKGFENVIEGMPLIHRSGTQGTDWAIKMTCSYACLLVCLSFGLHTKKWPPSKKACVALKQTTFLKKEKKAEKKKQENGKVATDSFLFRSD